MAIANGEQILKQLKTQERSWSSLTNSERSAVKNHVTFGRQKTFSAEKPLAATTEGQAQLKKQAASIPKPKKPKVEPVVEAPKTWGTELDEYLTQTFPQAYPAVKQAGSDIVSNPYVGTALGAIGAGATSLTDIIAEQIDPSSRKTVGESLQKQKQGMGQAGAEYLQQKGVTQPTLGGLKDLGVRDLAGLLQQTLGGLSKASRPPLDVTKGIYEQAAIASRGITPEQAKRESAAWVARNPNLAGTSSNIFGATIDPLNIPIAGAVSKISKALPKKAPTAEVKPTPPTQPQAPVQQAPAPPRQVAPQPQPQPEPDTFLPEGQLIPEIEKAFGVRRQYPKPITMRTPAETPPVATRLGEDLPAPAVAAVPEPVAAAPQPQPQPQPKPEPIAPKPQRDIKSEVEDKGFAEVDFTPAKATAFAKANPDYDVNLSLDKDGEPIYRITKKQPAPVTVAKTPTPVVEPTTTPIAEKIGEDVKPQPTTFALPQDLKGSKPRYSYGDKKFELEFDSDLDRALYIVAKATKSKADDRFMDALVKHTNLKPDEIRALGMQVRERIKQMAKDSMPGKLRIADTGLGKPSLPTKLGGDLAPKPVQPEPQAPVQKGTKPKKEVAPKEQPTPDQKSKHEVIMQKGGYSKAIKEVLNDFKRAIKNSSNAGYIESRVKFSTDKLNELYELAKIYGVKRLPAKPDLAELAPKPTPFKDGERFAASPGVPNEISEILKGWIDLLGMSNRVYITTADEAAKQKFTSSLFERQFLDEFTNGRSVTKGYPDTDAVIIYRPNKSMATNLEIISHELGHALMTAKYRTAPPHIRKAIDDEYDRWYVSVEGGTAQNLIDKLRSYKAAKMNRVPQGMMAKDMYKFDTYWSSKNEWFADQVARWATTSEKPLTVVEKFFSKLARTLKQFFQKNQDYLPSKTMKDWLDGLQKTASTSPNAVSKIDIIQKNEMVTLPKTERDVGDKALKATDADVERMLTATSDRSFRFQEKSKELMDNLRNMFLKFKPMGQISKFYSDLKGKSPANIIREAFYEGQRKVARSADEAERNLRTIFSTIKTKQDKELFTRFVVLRDALQTLRENALANLPNGVTKDQVVKELREITSKMRGNQGVIDAVKNYDNIMKKVYDDLVRRGVLKEESRRIGYYPHQVLKYATDIKLEKQLKLDTPSRGYSLRREGSLEPYDTDFEEVVRRTLTKVYSDNAIQETLAKVLRLSDALDNVSAESIDIRDGKNLLEQAQEASIKTPDYKPWKAAKVKELMQGGMNQRDAEKQAWVIWRRDVPKSIKDRFFMNKFREYAQSGMSKQNMVAKINKEWQDYKNQPKLVMQRVNDKTVVTANGKSYKLFKPRFKEEIYLVPEAVYDEIKDFGSPIYKDDEYILLALGRVTGFFKTTALTITAPARIVVDALSNAVKLGIMDTSALLELPRALRVVMSEADSPFAKKIAGYLKKLTVEKRAEVLDEYTRRFLVRHEIIEPAAVTKGVYQFTPIVEKVFRQIANIGGASRTATQRVDEIFRAAKVSRDLKRVISGQFADAKGVVDIEGLSKLGQVSKIGHEFTVNSMRQSKYMRRYFTQLMFPFLNWPAIDTLHLVRFAKNNPVKAGMYLAAITAGFEAWNNTGERRKVEELLPPEKRQVPHVITGFTGKENKPIIFYFPIFPGLAFTTATGLAKAPQNLTDAIVTSTIPGKEKKKYSEVLENPIEPLAKTVTTMANPFFRTGGELVFNKSLYTDRPIVKESEKGTGAAWTQRLKYALEQTAPPYRAFTSGLKESEKIMTEDDTAKRTETLAIALGKFFNPIKRIRKEEDIQKLAEAKSYSLVEQRQLKEKNPAYQKIRELYPKALNSGDFTAVADVMIQAQLSEREVESFIRSNYLAMVLDAFRQTTDPKKRAAYKEQIEELKGKKAEENVKRAGQGNLDEALRYYELQQKGVE